MKTLQRQIMATFASLGVGLIGGCGSREDELPRIGVSGKVMLDARPLEQGVISFVPEGGNANPVMVGGVISEGAYTIEPAKGPTPGKYRVSITGGATAPPPADDAPGRITAPIAGAVPHKYNAASTLKAEVTPDGPHAFDFALSSH